jgi:hypothetical protein
LTATLRAGVFSPATNRRRGNSCSEAESRPRKKTKIRVYSNAGFAVFNVIVKPLLVLAAVVMAAGRPAGGEKRT